MNTVDGVTALALCVLSDGILYLYKVSWKYHSQFFSHRVGIIFVLNNTKEHNSVRNASMRRF